MITRLSTNRTIVTGDNEYCISPFLLKRNATRNDFDKPAWIPLSRCYGISYLPYKLSPEIQTAKFEIALDVKLLYIQFSKA